MRRETFHTPGPLELDLRLPSGQIELQAVDGEETTVELDASHASDEVREVIENARIELRQRGGGHELVVDVQRNRRGFGIFLDSGGFTLSVQAPLGADAAFTTPFAYSY